MKTEEHRKNQVIEIQRMTFEKAEEEAKARILAKYRELSPEKKKLVDALLMRIQMKMI